LFFLSWCCEILARISRIWRKTMENRAMIVRLETLQQHIMFCPLNIWGVTWQLNQGGVMGFENS
jgi:hypothetical protein